MKKILLLFAFFVGLSSCETADEEPTLEQLVGEFEMTAELGEHLVSSLSDHMLIFQDWYMTNWEKADVVGIGYPYYYFDKDGTGIYFYSPMMPDLPNMVDWPIDWSYDKATNSVVVEGKSCQVVYYKHPVLIWKEWPGYREFVLEDKALLEEYMQKCHSALTE